MSTCRTGGSSLNRVGLTEGLVQHHEHHDGCCSRASGMIATAEPTSADSPLLSGCGSIADQITNNKCSAECGSRIISHDHARLHSIIVLLSYSSYNTLLPVLAITLHGNLSSKVSRGTAVCPLVRSQSWGWCRTSKDVHDGCRVCTYW